MQKLTSSDWVYSVDYGRNHFWWHLSLITLTSSLLLESSSCCLVLWRVLSWYIFISAVLEPFLAVHQLVHCFVTFMSWDPANSDHVFKLLAWVVLMQLGYAQRRRCFYLLYASPMSLMRPADTSAGNTVLSFLRFMDIDRYRFRIWMTIWNDYIAFLASMQSFLCL